MNTYLRLATLFAAFLPENRREILFKLLELRKKMGFASSPGDKLGVTCYDQIYAHGKNLCQYVFLLFIF